MTLKVYRTAVGIVNIILSLLLEHFQFETRCLRRAPSASLVFSSGQGHRREMDAVYCVDAAFTARHEIKSLPACHGARWSAWLRFACARLALRLENIVYALLPLRRGVSFILPGEELGLRLIVPHAALSLLPRIVEAMMEMPPQGEFSCRSLHFTAFREGVGGQPCALSELAASSVAPLTAERLAERVLFLQDCQSWSLNLFTPLRLTLPAGRKKGGDGVRRFCDPLFFQQETALPHLLSHVRLLPPVMCGQGMRLRAVSLHWEDMRYSRDRRMALGGVVGKIHVAGRPDAETARRLVLGEYLGAGKNGRFGLGFWRIGSPDS